MYASFYCHDKDWKEELADFLYYLSVFSCYPASSLVMKGECQQVREFLMIVESNLKAEQLRKLAEKPIPVAGPISLPELQEAEEEEEEEEEEEANTKKSALLLLSERLKNSKVDVIVRETKRKSVAAKIMNFFKKFSKKKTTDETAEDAVLGALEEFEHEVEEGEEEGEENESPEPTPSKKPSLKDEAEEQKRKERQHEEDYQAYKKEMIRQNPSLKNYDDELFRKDFEELLEKTKK